MNVLTAALAFAPHLPSAHPVWVQGALANGGGAVDGTYDLSVAFYAGPQGGEPLATHQVAAVVVTDGVFSVAVDTLPEPVLTAAQVWVGVAVSGEPELPRQRLGAVAFALQADTARGLRCEGCVTALTIAQNAIYTEALQDGSVGGAKLAPGAVKAVNLDQAAVGTAAIQSNAVQFYHLADGAVVTAALAPLAVTTAKLATGAVTSSVILDGTIQAVDLADRVVGEAQIALASIGTHHISAAGIDSTRIKFAVDSGSFCNNTTATKIKGLTEAVFCALSYVDDDSAAGSCRVFRGGDGWYVQTGSDCGANACGWVCFL